MTDGPLAGRGVLVTRPAEQSDSLAQAIRAAGGRPWLFPVMEILPRGADAFDADIQAAGCADLTIFVSANAVRHGLAALDAQPEPGNDDAGRGRIAAIGPATLAALEATGVRVDIRPGGGYRSEHLLTHPTLEDVSGWRITIVRGDAGRELLAESLRQRGATVTHVSAYSAQRRDVPAADVDALLQALDAGDIGATTVMSVASFDHLAEILPSRGIDRLAGTRLVAPGARVIQTLAERLPGAHLIEASGPNAEAMIDALVASFSDAPDDI